MNSQYSEWPNRTYKNGPEETGFSIVNVEDPCWPVTKTVYTAHVIITLLLSRVEAVTASFAPEKRQSHVLLLPRFPHNLMSPSRAESPSAFLQDPYNPDSPLDRLSTNELHNGLCKGMQDGTSCHLRSSIIHYLSGYLHLCEPLFPRQPVSLPRPHNRSIESPFLSQGRSS